MNRANPKGKARFVRISVKRENSNLGRFESSKNTERDSNLERFESSKNTERDSNLERFESLYSCGKRGIRTPEPVSPVTRFPGVPLQPLEHLSNSISKNSDAKVCFFSRIKKILPAFFVILSPNHHFYHGYNGPCGPSMTFKKKDKS